MEIDTEEQKTPERNGEKYRERQREWNLYIHVFERERDWLRERDYTRELEGEKEWGIFPSLSVSVVFYWPHVVRMSDQSPQLHTDSLTVCVCACVCVCGRPCVCDFTDSDVRWQLVYTVNVFVCEFVQLATSLCILYCNVIALKFVYLLCACVCVYPVFACMCVSVCVCVIIL